MFTALGNGCRGWCVKVAEKREAINRKNYEVRSTLTGALTDHPPGHAEPDEGHASSGPASQRRAEAVLEVEQVSASSQPRGGA
jgi:hypothetical protein